MEEEGGCLVKGFARSKWDRKSTTFKRAWPNLLKKVSNGTDQKKRGSCMGKKKESGGPNLREHAGGENKGTRKTKKAVVEGKKKKNGIGWSV